MAFSKGQIKSVNVMFGDPMKTYDFYYNSNFQVTEGHLHILDKLGDDKCVYAPGQWSFVEADWSDAE